MEFKNASKLEFTDIGSEVYRTYVYPDGGEIRIDEPLKLNVSESGGHRIFSSDGKSHYIPKGWRHLYWEVKPGQPNFVK